MCGPRRGRSCRWARSTASTPEWAGSSPSRWACSMASGAPSGARSVRSQLVMRSPLPRRLRIALETRRRLAECGRALGSSTLLIGLGLWQLRGHRHAVLGRWRVAGLRATGRELTVWSFIVATAHGAGLMAAPFALRAAVREWQATWPCEPLLGRIGERGVGGLADALGDERAHRRLLTRHGVTGGGRL